MVGSYQLNAMDVWAAAGRQLSPTSGPLNNETRKAPKGAMLILRGIIPAFYLVGKPSASQFREIACGSVVIGS